MNPRINPDDYVLPEGLSDTEVVERLSDPLVRICNLYKIEDPDGRVVRFIPNGPQCEVLHAVYVAGEQRIAIPKARAIGFSTLIALILFDDCHFSSEQQPLRAAIIDQTAADAQAKIMTIDGIDDARVELVWDPAWNQEMISEEGKMKLGMI